MGVGPEQNFTYIAALKPAMAFIVDVRRGNLQMHLMYKALFEMSADRPDFVSRLFSRKRPAGLTAASNVRDIFQAYAVGARPDDEAVRGELQGDHRSPAEDARLRARPRGRARASATSMSTSAATGPELTYWMSGGGGGAAAAASATRRPTPT